MVTEAKYDLCVIGGGAAGTRAALTARDAGLRTVLVEQGAPGGAVNISGHYAMESLLDDLEQGRSQSYSELIQSEKNRQTQVSGAVAHHLKACGAVVVPEAATLIHRHAEGFTVGAGEDSLLAARILVATGSLPLIPELPGIDRALDEGFALSNPDVIGARRLRKSAVVWGGSLRGVQLALFYRLMSIPCTLLVPPDGIAPELEPDIAACLSAALEEKGISLQPYSSVQSAGRGVIRLTDEKGCEAALETNALVLGSQRLPATRGLGLGELGVVLRGRAIAASVTGHTNLADIYAAGDCTGTGLTSEAAKRSADHCIYGMTGYVPAMSAVSSRTGLRAMGGAFSIGETMESAAARNLRPVQIKLPLPYLPGTMGLCKLIASRAGHKLIGAHLIGADTAELSRFLAAAVESGRRTEELRPDMNSLSAQIVHEGLFYLKRQL